MAFAIRCAVLHRDMAFAAERTVMSIDNVSIRIHTED